MTTTALNNLWTYLKGLSLGRREREWLAGKLIEAGENSEAQQDQQTSDYSEEKAKANKVRVLSPEIEALTKLNIPSFTQEQLENDPLLAAITEERRYRK